MFEYINIACYSLLYILVDIGTVVDIFLMLGLLAPFLVVTTLVFYYLAFTRIPNEYKNIIWNIVYYTIICLYFRD